MADLKTIYDELLPDVKLKLRASAREYATAKRLKYTLMSKYLWSHLTVDEVRDLLTYGGVNSWELDSFSFMYGDKIIDKN